MSRGKWGGKGRLAVLETVLLRGHQPEGPGIKRSIDRRAIDSCQLYGIQNATSGRPGDMRIEAFQFVERGWGTSDFVWSGPKPID